MVKPILIFDFDGTIANSVKLVLKATNELADFYKFAKIEEDDIERMRKLHIKEFLNQIGLSFYKRPFFLYSIRKKLEKNLNEIELCLGIKEVLKALKENGYILAIITSNSKENVRKFLQMNEINIFDFIDSGNIFTALFGKHRLINKFLKSKQDAFYIGDEIRDIEAARKSKIKVISVCWGANSKESLEKHNPDFIASTPNDILKILENENIIFSLKNQNFQKFENS